MNLPNSSIRGFFEILMPGIFLVINIALAIIFALAVLSPHVVVTSSPIFEKLANNSVAILLLLIVFGYPVGIVLRLMKTARIDSLSARYLRLLKPKFKNELYLADEFFYNNWMLKKCETMMPAAVAQFYKDYWADKDTGNQSLNSSFFNFCKAIVSKYDVQSGNDIFAAEALNRILAGSFYALEVSVLFMFADTLIAYFSPNQSAVIFPAAITLGYFWLLHIILSQFRLLRCKEVDTVFNACFANKEYFEKLLPTNYSRQILQNHPDSEYGNRRDLIIEAQTEKLTERGLVQSINLDLLTGLMKQKSQTHPYLSSIYFSGAYIDHPYFLETTKVAIGIAVLPEDSAKAGIRKKHPYQTEIILVLDGQLCLHVEERGKMVQKKLSRDEHYVIREGICHWITSLDEMDSVFMFIKTNPAQEPVGESCSQ